MEDMAMRAFDLTPVRRSTIGFDRLFDLIDDSFRLQGEDNYRPYNIARVGEDHYRISLALAGFKPEEITVTAEQNMLTVEGRKAENGDHDYLFQGISAAVIGGTLLRAVYRTSSPMSISAAGPSGNLPNSAKLFAMRSRRSDSTVITPTSS